MPPASLSTDAKSEARGAESTARSRRARRKPQPRRWMREAQGIVALAVATFVFVALTVFDPAVPPGHQAALVGPVGIWLAWGVFRAFGYAGFLFPLLAAAWGVPGAAVVVVRGDETLVLKGYGVRRVGGRDPVTPDTLFPLASCSKAFTTTLLAVLADDGITRQVPQAFHLAGLIHTKRARFDEAAAAYRQYLAAAPQAPNAGEVRSQLNEWEVLGVIKPAPPAEANLAEPPANP